MNWFITSVIMPRDFMCHGVHYGTFLFRDSYQFALSSQLVMIDDVEKMFCGSQCCSLIVLLVIRLALLTIKRLFTKWAHMRK